MLCITCSIVWPHHASLAQAPPPGIPQAMAALQRGDPQRGVQILEESVKREPKNVRAWRALGFVAIKAGKYDRALEAYSTALKIEPNYPPALYNVGVAHALKKEPDAAFEWLRKAKATHKVDMAQIEVDADLLALKSDPRFKALLPTPEEFRYPFVEPVKILREWDGEATNDQFGWIARSMGDVDGDGIIDVVTSAPTKAIGEANAGRVYVYSSRTGKLLWKVDGKPGDMLGLGVECAGDVNRDGVPDVIAGAPGAGKCYVYSGKDGRVLLTLTAENVADAFGRHVAGVGDIDGDGYADVMVGAPGNSAGGPGAGRAYVYSGKDGHVLLTLTGENPVDAFGSTVAGYSDQHHHFLIVGAPGGGMKHAGATYVYDGPGNLSNGHSDAVRDASPGIGGRGAKSQSGPTPKFVIQSDETGSALGNMFVSVVGDLDGDGVPDIYATDFANSANGPGSGRAYVRSGADGHPLLTLTGETAGEGFGIGRADAGDVNHDGHADLVIGSWQFAGAAISGGKVTVFSGKDGSKLRTITGKILGETLGFDAVGIGDVDGDGIPDLLITSAWSGIHGYHSGRIYIISTGRLGRLPSAK